MSTQNHWIVPAAILTLIVILAVAAGTAAVALGGRLQAINLIKVPDDYKTIQAAIDAARPGDIIQVRPGTYPENITFNKAVSLTAQSFDQVNATDNTTFIDGGNGAAAILIPAGLTQMPTIRGFVIRNGKSGIEAHSQFIAESNYFNGSSVLVDYEAGSGGINRSNVYFNSADDAIHVDALNMPLLIENNRIMYSRDDAIEIALRNNPVPPAPVEMDIWNNMLIGSNQDGILFVDYPGDPQDTNRKFFITGNLFANNRRAGIGFMPNANSHEDYSAAGTAEAVRAYNNTFYGNDYGISGGENMVAFNNIIANTSSRGVWRVRGGPGANSVIAYTLFFNNRLDADQSNLSVGNILDQDPLFAEAPGPGPDGAWGTVDDNFSGLVLQPGSPAIDKGVTQLITASGEAVPASPITGFTGAAPDLGWREFGSPVFLTSTPTAIVSMTPTIASTPGTTTATAGVTVTPTGASATPGPSNTPSSPTPATSTPPAPSATPPAGTSTPAGSATSQQATILGISPSSASAGTSVTLTISGSGFQSGATVSLEGASGTAPTVTGVQVIGSTSLKVSLTIPSDVSGTEHWDLVVTNPDGSSAIIKNAFTVSP